MTEIILTKKEIQAQKFKEYKKRRLENMTPEQKQREKELHKARFKKYREIHGNYNTNKKYILAYQQRQKLKKLEATHADNSEILA